MSWRLLNLASSEYETRPEPPSLCGLIYAGRRHLVSGPPEANKTLFALILGLELIRTSGTFALIDFESGPETTRLMLTELGASQEELGRVLYPEVEGRPPDGEDVRALVAGGAKLAIIDAAIGAYDASGLDDNQRSDAEKFGRAWIDPLWQEGVATLLVDHVVKSSEGRGKFAIGSERKAGRTDVHLGLEAKLQLTRGTRGLVRVTTHKDRPGWIPRPHAAELELQSDPETHAIRWEFKPADAEQTGDHWQPTALMQKVSEYLERQSEPVSRNIVEHAIRGTAEYKRQAMDELVTAGHAEETAGPRGSRLLRSLSPFPTSSDFVGTSSATQSTTLATSSSASALYTDDEDEVDEAELDRLHLVGKEMGLT